MKQWNGLLRKEWVQWRWTLLVLAILMVTELIRSAYFCRKCLRRMTFPFLKLRWSFVS